MWHSTQREKSSFYFLGVNHLDFDKLKTVPLGLKNLSYVVDNQIVQNTKFNALKAKVNDLEKSYWSKYFNSY